MFMFMWLSFLIETKLIYVDIKWDHKTHNPKPYIYASEEIITIKMGRRARLFSLGSPVSSTSKTDFHNIAEILLKVVLNPRIDCINDTNCKDKYVRNLKLKNPALPSVVTSRLH